MHWVCLFFASLFCTAPLAAQTTVRLGQSAAIPTLSSGTADHATVAISDEGHIFVAWQNQVDVGQASSRQIEGAFIRYAGGPRWDVPDQADILLLGDPALGLLDTVDACRKPDVVSVGSNFLVTWPRVPDSAPGDGQLEVVLVEVPPSGPPIVHAPTPGAGYVIDPSIPEGLGGVMPDLTRVGGFIDVPDQGLVAYATLSFESGGFFEYDLRLAYMDFSGGGVPVFDGPYTLVPNIPFDDYPNGGPNGGRILPDLVEHEDGAFVIGYEEYAQAAHISSTFNEGYLRVKRFQYSFGSGGPVITDTVDLVGSNLTYRQRRPNLSSSYKDADNHVALGWTEFPDGGLGDDDSYHFELSFPGGGTIQTANWNFPNDPFVSDGLPIPTKAAGLDLMMVTNDSPGFYRLASWAPNKASVLIPVFTTGNAPWRPATDVLEFGTIGAPESRILPITYEAVVPGSGVDRIFILIQLI